MSTSKHKTIVGDIAGGTKPLARDMGDNMTIQHIWSVYRWYPGFKEMIQLETDAIFSNGVNEKDIIDTPRKIECQDALLWAIMVGYSICIVDARTPGKESVQAWHPYIDGIGFQYTEFSMKGNPLEVEIHVNPNENADYQPYTVPHYPCEIDDDGEYITSEPIPGGYGFFWMRTRGAIKGIQGLPQYLHLIDPIIAQWDILKAYIPYAQKQGWSFPVVGLEDNSNANRTNVKQQFATQPTNNRLLIIGNEDAVEWIAPSNGAYDPFPMLQWINGMIARATQLNKMMLEGDPGGHLSASETTANNWTIKNKEKQAYWKTQFIGVWKALGASDDCDFQDPAQPTFINLMEGLKNMREAMEGIVEPEDIVKQFNEYLAKNNVDVELRALPKEEMMQEKEEENAEQQDNNGSKAKDKTDV